LSCGAGVCLNVDLDIDVRRRGRAEFFGIIARAHVEIDALGARGPMECRSAGLPAGILENIPLKVKVSGTTLVTPCRVREPSIIQEFPEARRMRRP
jgi:hypothetical protein